MPKLTDTQLVILSTAVQRDDRAVLPLPRSLKFGASAKKSLDALLRKGLIEEREATRDAEVWREDSGTRLMLVLSEAGLAAIEGPTASAVEQPQDTPKRASRGRGKEASEPKESAEAASRPGSKQALLIDLLRRRNGASIDEIVEATGWQAHSVRGAISGTLKKKLGFDVTSEKTECRGRVYRIAGGR